jgi:predicted Rdx family selenoprotein
LAAALKETLGIDATLTKGSGGVFDVKAAGKTIYSKHATGRFPDSAEIVGPLGELLAA